jgi:hypothetical protein
VRPGQELEALEKRSNEEQGGAAEASFPLSERILESFTDGKHRQMESLAAGS